MNTVNQNLLTENILVKPLSKSRAPMESLGIQISRYGLVLTLLLIGVLKFTPGEAKGIQPLVAHSPLMSWLYQLFSVQGVSNLIGVIEILVALLMALRPLSARLSFIGSQRCRIVCLPEKFEQLRPTCKFFLSRKRGGH